MISFNCVKRFKSGVSKKLGRSKRRSSLHSMPRGVEVLESRELLATFLVTNLRNYGAGSFRQAIIESNQRPGSDREPTPLTLMSPGRYGTARHRSLRSPIP